MALPEDEKEWDNMYIMFATERGNIRTSDMEDFKRINANGKIAIRLDEKDSLTTVKLCQDNQHIFMATNQGKAIRFPVDSLRVIKSRTSNGVRGMKIGPKDKIISMSILDSLDEETKETEIYLSIPSDSRKLISKCIHQYTEDQEKCSSTITEIIEPFKDKITLEQVLAYANKEEFILTITENGFGKRTSSFEYRITARGGKGIKNIITSSRNGKVIASFPVTATDHIMLITNKGKMIRTLVDQISMASRSTQGVKILDTSSGEKVVSIAKVEASEDASEEVSEE